MVELPTAVASSMVWTVGHSNRTWEEFHRLLAEHRIQQVSDVRHFPSSKYVPWTNRDVLDSALRTEGIDYAHFVDLGGFRRPRPDSENRSWRSAGFRGYADHMETAEFRAALDRLLDLVASQRTVVMCAEALPSRCHRSLLADALLASGARVVHILAPGRTADHHLTSFARVRGHSVTYPGPPEKDLKLRGR